MHGQGGAPKRYFGLDTLATAVDKLLMQKRNFLLESVHRVLGPLPVTALEFALAEESKHGLRFRVQAANAKRKKAVLALWVSNRHGGVSKTAAEAHGVLRTLHERAPDHVIRPLAGGRVLLPPKRGKAAEKRELYGWCSEWLNGYYPLDVGANGQCAVWAPRPKAFSLAQSDALRGQLVEGIIRSYDPKTNTAMEVPHVPVGDVAATQPQKTAPRLKIVACRRLIRNMNPVKLIHRVATARWSVEDGEVPVAPSDPAVFIAAVERAVGRDLARAWLGHYAKALGSGAYAEDEALPLAALPGGAAVRG